MKHTVMIRNLTLGAEMPKICVPVMGESREDVLQSAREAMEQSPDMIEWRVDYLEALNDSKEVCRILGELRMLCGELPLLFTLRTKEEGGEQEVTKEEYRRLYLSVLECGDADIIDVEYGLGEKLMDFLIEEAHAHGMKVLASAHDFHKTPPKEELLARLARMERTGADIVKIAVMPENMSDVLTLLAATEEASRSIDAPVITMSMGAAGMVSRLIGEAFGSAVTFGMAGRASAPGQIPAGELRMILENIHRYG